MLKCTKHKYTNQTALLHNVLFVHRCIIWNINDHHNELFYLSCDAKFFFIFQENKDKINQPTSETQY